MENNQPKETVEFLWRRLHEECPTWAIGVPVLFAFLVVALVVIFRPERKLIAALVGGVIVGIISLVYLPIAYILVPLFSWMVILIPVMAVALFYVAQMYVRDAKSVHFLWAIFLGLLRTTVYVILAGVFLLPGCQHFEKQEYESKVVFLFDVSGSMFVVDDLPEPGKDPKKLPTRQDKILKFLAEGNEPFIDRVVQKSPVTAGRFGPSVDETDLINLHQAKQKSLTAAEWKTWLNPNKKDIVNPDVEHLKTEKEKEDARTLAAKKREMVDMLRSGTNIGGSALQMHKLENSSFIQAFIIISDGQSNLGSDDARSEFMARVSAQKRTIPVITVGVGQFRLPVSIRIDDINAPEESRPDDAFKVKVPLVSTGIAGEAFNVTLEVKRVEDALGKAVANEETYPLPAKQGVFKGAGDHQQGVVEFEVDVQKLKGIPAAKDESGLLDGKWQIVAKTPRHAKEPFPDEFHVADPIYVQVQKRPLRVLLMAGGATREYQFLRTILYREMTEKRMELCILNQSTGKEDHVDQDVEPDRMLTDFPDRIGPNAVGQRFMSLSDYDVIIAFDPDWTRLTVAQRNLLKTWVDSHAGGIIFVAGPVFSYQLARPGGNDFNSLLSLYPVVLKDSRLHGIGLSGTTLGHDPTRRYALNFTAAAKQYEFLKLDEAGESPTAGWNKFFWNDEKFTLPVGKDTEPRRGFNTYYPVERLKTASEVVATFAGPKEGRIGDKTDAFKDQQPFIVSMRSGAGRTLYLGSGELWRLRAFKDGYHERLWIKMARHVASGAKQQKKFGRILMARNVPVGRIEFEAQLKGEDQQPLRSDVISTVYVRRLDKNNRPDAKEKEKDKKETKKEVKGEKETNRKFDLKPKPSDEDWQGYFYGSIQIPEDGEYEFRLPVHNSKGDLIGELRQNLIVRKPDPETDNVRTNFAYLYQLASPADTLLKGLPPETRKKIEEKLQVPDGQSPGDEKLAKRLYFPLSAADTIADCLVPVPPKSDIVKGRFEDLWDKGGELGLTVPIYWAALLTPILVGLVGAVLLLLLRQWISAIGFFAACVVLSLLAQMFCFFPNFTVVLACGLGALGALIYGGFTAFKKDYIVAAIMVVIALGVGYLGVHALLNWNGVLTNVSDSVWNDSLPVGFSFLLVAAVSLVGIEWLTRKLLRLA